ncbi:MAG: hypothetical protein ABWY29_01320 [Blastococcus sp.]
MWEGWGWVARGPPADALAGPRLRHPGRDYLVFGGPLRAALRMGEQVTDDWFSPQSPNLMWPDDRSWCLASEIDFDSTLIGGSQELVDALLGCPGLEAWPVSPTDDLSFRGDRINV